MELKGEILSLGKVWQNLYVCGIVFCFCVCFFEGQYICDFVNKTSHACTGQFKFYNEYVVCGTYSCCLRQSYVGINKKECKLGWSFQNVTKKDMLGPILLKIQKIEMF